MIIYRQDRPTGDKEVGGELPQRFHITFTSIAHRAHIDFTSFSRRFHINGTAISHQFHIDFTTIRIIGTSISRRFHIDFTTISHLFRAERGDFFSHRHTAPPPGTTRAPGTGHRASGTGFATEIAAKPDLILLPNPLGPHRGKF